MCIDVVLKLFEVFYVCCERVLVIFCFMVGLFEFFDGIVELGLELCVLCFDVGEKVVEVVQVEGRLEMVVKVVSNVNVK